MGKKSNKKKIVREMLKEKQEEDVKKEKGILQKLKKKKSKKELKKELLEEAEEKAKKEKEGKKKKLKGTTKPSEAKKASKGKTTKTKKQKLAPAKKTKEKKKKTAKAEKTKKLKINKQKLAGVLLVIIVLSALCCIGYLLFKKAFSPNPLAKLIPADETVVLLELNTNENHTQVIRTFDLLEEYPEFSKENLIQKAEEKFALDYKEISLWLGRNVGMAILNTDTEELDVLYFAEVIDNEEFKKFIKNTTSASFKYLGKNVFRINNFYLTLEKNHLAMSEKKESIERFIEFNKSSNPSLIGSSPYRRINNNLPVNKLGFLYLDFSKLSDGFFQKYPILSEKGLSMAVVEPLIQVFEAEGFAFIALEDNFSIQSFMILDTEKLKDSDYLNIRKKYTASLTSYLDKNTLAFWGGENLQIQTKRFLDILAGGSEVNLFIFESVFQSYGEKYFGEGVNFEKEILSLFRNEYVFAIEEGKNDNVYKLIIKLDNKDQLAKIHELANKFANIGGIFEPKIVEHILEDGTVSREIRAIPEKIIKNKSEYKNSTIYHLEMGQRDWGIFFVFIKNIAVFATSLESIHDTIDLVEDSSENLKNSEVFDLSIQPILRSSDEITYLDFKEIAPFFIKEIEDFPVLDIISKFSSGRNYFHDGIVTIHYIFLR